jgi:hypothetical protein
MVCSYDVVPALIAEPTVREALKVFLPLSAEANDLASERLAQIVFLLFFSYPVMFSCSDLLQKVM